MIYDFFILKNGIPLFLINLEPKFSVSTDDTKVTLVSGFFQAIASFADTMENLGQVDEIQMTDILFSFQRMVLENQEGDLLFVLSTDGRTPKHIRKIIIEETSSTFLHIFNDRVISKWDGNVEPFKSFRTVFLEIVKGVLESNNTENLDIHTDQVTQLVRFSPVSDNRTSVSSSYSALTNFNSSSSSTLRTDNSSQNQTRLNKHLLSQQLSLTQHSQQSHRLNDSGFQNGSQFQVIEKAPNDSDSSLHSSQQSNLSSLPINSIQRFQREFSPQYSQLMQSIIRSNSVPYDAVEYDSKYYHPSVYDLIPVKNPLTAGTFRYKIANNHAKMLIVAIDGQKSIRHLANMLNSHPQDIFGQCQDFQNQGFISFKKL